MFFSTSINDHNMPYNPFKACVVPRPIGWISSVSSDNIINIAPYSYFNAISDVPPMIMFASSQKRNWEYKDTIRNIEATGDFVVNIATAELMQDMIRSSADLPYNVSEAEKFNIKTTKANLVKSPLIKSSPISLECLYVKTIDLNINQLECTTKVVIGHVIGINIDESVITEGRVDISKLKPLARLGYNQYSIINDYLEINKA